MREREREREIKILIKPHLESFVKYVIKNMKI